MDDFELVERVYGDWTIIAVKGDLDVYTAPKLRTLVIDTLESGSNKIGLELSSGFVDSTGLAVIVGALKRARQHGGEFCLIEPSEQIRRILTITDLDKIVTVRSKFEDPVIVVDDVTEKPNIGTN